MTIPLDGLPKRELTDFSCLVADSLRVLLMTPDFCSIKPLLAFVTEELPFLRVCRDTVLSKCLTSLVPLCAEAANVSALWLTIRTDAEKQRNNLPTDKLAMVF